MMDLAGLLLSLECSGAIRVNCGRSLAFGDEQLLAGLMVAVFDTANRRRDYRVAFAPHARNAFFVKSRGPAKFRRADAGLARMCSMIITVFDCTFWGASTCSKLQSGAASLSQAASNRRRRKGGHLRDRRMLCLTLLRHRDPSAAR